MSLLFGMQINLGEIDRGGSLKGWKSSALDRVIDVAVRQLESQRESLDRTLSRAQLLFTTTLGLAVLLANPIAHAWSASPSSTICLSRAGLALSAVLLLLALLGSASVVAVRKYYDKMSAVVISKWDAFDLEDFATNYVECVDQGERTTNAQLTVFGTSVRLAVYSAAAFAVSLVVLYWPISQIATP